MQLNYLLRDAGPFTIYSKKSNYYFQNVLLSMSIYYFYNDVRFIESSQASKSGHINKSMYPLTYPGMAEGVGFEPTVRLHAQRFSRPPPSSTRPPLRRKQFFPCMFNKLVSYGNTRITLYDRLEAWALS